MCLGKHNLTHTEPSEHCFNLSGIYRHEGFKHPPIPTVQSDIALVKLDGEVIPSDEISYACLPSEEEILPGGKMCYAIGWGAEAGTVHTVHTSLDLYSELKLNKVLPYYPLLSFYYPNASLLTLKKIIVKYSHALCRTWCESTTCVYAPQCVWLKVCVIHCFWIVVCD